MKRFCQWPTASRIAVFVLPLAVLLVAGCGESQGKSSRRSGSPSKSSVQKCLKIGKQAILDKDREKAVRAYTKAIKLDSECREAYLWRGIARNELGDSRNALEDFSKAIELDPRSSSYAYEQRAQIHLKHGQRSQARADDEMAAAIRNKEWGKLPEKRQQFEDKRRKK